MSHRCAHLIAFGLLEEIPICRSREVGRAVITNDFADFSHHWDPRSHREVSLFRVLFRLPTLQFAGLRIGKNGDVREHAEALDQFVRWLSYVLENREVLWLVEPGLAVWMGI